MNQPTAMADVYLGDSTAMTAIEDGKAALIVTSPLYFSKDTEPSLRAPLRKQTDYDRVVAEVTEYALSLRAHFQEMFRVLKPSGFLVVQTRHIRYGDYLIPLADLHCELALNCGFRLVSKVDWLPVHPRPSRIPKFVDSQETGNFRTLDTEIYLIFVKGKLNPQSHSIEDLSHPPRDLVQPLWRTHTANGGHHPYASPPEMMHRFVQLFSKTGDLVVDPFCGSGTTLLVARELGRHSIGYEIDSEYAAIARKRLS